VRVFLLLLLASPGFAQSGNAIALLERVAGVARGAASWRIEGSVQDSEDGQSGSPADFSMLIDADGRLRFEQTGRFPALVVCSVDKVWVYSPPLRRYQESTRTNNDLCEPIVGGWEVLPSTVLSPSARPGLTPQNCELVTGILKPDLSPMGEVRRTLCIDAGRTQILWDKFESRYSSRTYTFRRVERNVEIPVGDFVFEPPPGAVVTPYELPVPRTFGKSLVPLPPGVSAPQLVKKKDLNYDEAARKAGVEGIVVLYLVVDSAGSPSEVMVFQSLTEGLNAEAVRTVSEWRFQPAMKDGKPVAVPLLVELNFRLAH
jgi:TonB family protein